MLDHGEELRPARGVVREICTPERAGLVTGRPPGDDGVQVAIDSFMLARREPPAAR